jgi:serine/threonine protein kinase
LKGPIDSIIASYVIFQLLSIVSKMHKKNIVHLDIKSRNILIDINFQITLVDFNIAKYIKEPMIIEPNILGQYEEK